MPKWFVNDLNFIPAPKFDENGYPVMRYPIGEQRRSQLNEEQRQVRFLMRYNVSAGNESESCREAGVPRSKYLEWRKTNPLFAQKLQEQKDEIIDRIKSRLTERAGLTAPTGLDGKANDSVLIAMWKALRPEDFDGVSDAEAGPVIESSIPRPQRPAQGGDLRSDGKTGEGSFLPS